MLETMTILEVVASLWIGIMVVVSVMAGVIKADEYFYKRKRLREINERHEERMTAMVERNAEFMLRMGMNPAYAINNSMPLCTASRSSILTDMPRPEPMTRPTDVPEWDGAAVETIGPFIPWRSIDVGFRSINEDYKPPADEMERRNAIPAPDVFRLPSPMHDYLKSEGLLPEEVDDDRDDET